MNIDAGQPVTETQIGNRYLPWLLALFVGSGCAALIYEVVWLQLLQLVIGSSGISLGVLLGTFMGGMCLGSFLMPRWIPRTVHPLRLWALLEFGIALAGIVVSSGMPVLAELYANYLGHGIVSRAAIAVICLLPPTLLMGATLPAIARWVENTPEGVSWMGFFYGGNIAGAVLGCLLAGFYLLRLYDMPTAIYVAFVINVTVGIFSLVVSYRATSRKPSSGTAPAVIRTPLEIGAVHFAIAISGLSALGAEVVWTRLLSLMLGGTVYTFAIILAIFLAGLGIGSSAGAFLTRRTGNARTLLGICQLLAAAAVAWAGFIMAYSLPYWPINPSLATGEWGPWNVFQLDLLRTAWVVLPGAVLWGASFPLALGAVASPSEDPGRTVGGLYAANTVGAIIGSLLFSMVLIPQVGTQWAQRLLILSAGVSAIIALAPMIVVREDVAEMGGVAKRKLPFLRPANLFALIGLLMVGLLPRAVGRVPWISVAWGRYAATYMSESIKGIFPEQEVPLNPAGPERRYCIYVGEGMNVSVAVTKSTSGSRYFHGAGKVQASSDPQDMRLQRMLGHLSVLVQEKPDQVHDVLVVACGAGVTAGTFVPYPNIRKITICDIEPLVPKMVAPIFGPENYHVVDGIDRENPRHLNGKEIRVQYDDGRHYIHTLPNDAKFDIITSDPIDPWVKGSAALNTVEYYQMCKQHLKPSGVMSLWIPLYESNDETTKSVIGTFFSVFPNGILFSNDNGTGGYDAVLLGQVEPTKIDVDRLQRLLDSDPYREVKASLVQVGFGRGAAGEKAGTMNRGVAVELLATYAGSAPDLKDWWASAQINTDRNLRLQYLAGMWFNSYIATAILDGILRYYRYPDQLFTGSPEAIEAMKEALADIGRRDKH